MFAGHKVKGSNSSGAMVINTLLFVVLCPRCAINVTQSSRTTTPNITAVPAGRASAMAALPNPPPSPREAGVLALSECVTSASSREPRTQVHTVYNVRCRNVCLFSFESHFNLWWKSAQKRHSFFFPQSY